MAKKKVYFFKIVLFDGAEIKDYKLTKNILNEIDCGSHSMVKWRTPGEMLEPIKFSHSELIGNDHS